MPDRLCRGVSGLVGDGVIVAVSIPCPWCARYLALELGERRIRVNSVAPGPTRTRIAGDAFERFPEVIPPLVARTIDASGGFNL